VIMIGFPIQKSQILFFVAAFVVLAQPRAYEVATGTAKTFASKYKPIPGYSPELVLVADRDLKIGGRQFRRGEEITFAIDPGTRFVSDTSKPGQAVIVEPGQSVTVEYDPVSAKMAGDKYYVNARVVRVGKTSPPLQQDKRPTGHRLPNQASRCWNGLQPGVATAETLRLAREKHYSCTRGSATRASRRASWQA
jgi:hypothetical protein